MESILKHEQGLEQEAVGSKKTVTSTCRGVQETDRTGLSYETIMDSDSDFLDNLQPPTLETLSNEIINSGTQSSVSTCHKELSQGSHDLSLSNNNTQGICDAALMSELSSPVIKTEKRHVDSEMRPLKEENKTHFKELETSSDDTDEWETASESTLDSEPHDQERIREYPGSYGEERHNEDAGPHGPKISEDAVIHGLEAESEDAGPHGQEKASDSAGPGGQEKTNEGAENHGHEIVSRDTGPQDQEKVSEDNGPHGQEKASDSAGPGGQEKLNEGAEHHGHEIVSKDTGPHDQEKVSEDDGPHDPEKVSEDDVPHGQEKVSDSAGPGGQEKINEGAENHGHKIVSKDTGPHDQEKVSKDDGPHDHKKVSEDDGTHDQQTVSMHTEPHGQEEVSKEAEIHGPEKVGEESALHGHKTLSEDTGPHDNEKVSAEDKLHSQETVSVDVGLYSPETLIVEIGPHSLERLNEEDKLHGQDTVSKDVEPRNERMVEDTAPHSHEMLSEEAEPHGHDTVSEVAGPYGQETVLEEAGPHSQEEDGEKAGPHGQETVDEVDGLYGQDSISEENVPYGLEIFRTAAEPLRHVDMDTDNGEATLDIQDTSNEDTRYYGQEKINEEAESHGQDIVSEETGSLVDEIASDLSRYCNVSEVVQPLGNETVSDASPHGSNADPELQDNETAGGMGSEELDENGEINPYKDHISAVPDLALNDILILVKAETTDDKNEILSTERLDENKLSNSAEVLESVREEIKSDSINDGVNKGAFSEGTDGGHFEMGCQATHEVGRTRDPEETQDVYMETVNDEVVNVHRETQVVHTGRDNEENQDAYKRTDSHEMQGICKETVGENALQQTPDSEDTEVGEASMVEVTKMVKEVTEPSSEERETEKKQAHMKSNEDCEHKYEFSKTSRVLEESVTNKDEIDDGCQQRWELTEASQKRSLTEEMEIAYLECERLEEKLYGTKTLLETDEGLSENFPNTLNQETILELQYSTPVTTDEKSYMDYTMDTETQLDVSSPPVAEEKGQADYAKTLSDIETKSSTRPSDTQYEPSNNLGFGYNAEPDVSSDGQGIGEPCFQLSVQSAHSEEDSSIVLQHKRLGDPEPHWKETTTVEMLEPLESPCFSQVDQSSQEVPRDEPDHYKLEFFPMTFKDIGVVSEDRTELGPKSKAHDFLQEHIDTECIQETIPQSVKRSVHQDSTLSDIHPVIGLDQDLMAPESETEKTKAIHFENIKLIRRQRSNTDPCLLHDQEETLQPSSNTEGSSRGRLRSLTPPCDKFTSSYIATSPKTVDKSTTDVFYAIPAESKAPHKAKGTSAKDYTIYPTQIFNPMLLQGHILEESGFYQEETFRQDNMENASQEPFQSPPQVPPHARNPESIGVEPDCSLKPTEVTFDSKSMPVPSATPVWRLPQPTRYLKDSGGVSEIRSIKSPEIPLMRRATIRHKKSTAAVKPPAKRFSNPNIPVLPLRDYPAGPGACNLPTIQAVNVNKIKISSQNRHLPYQQKILEEPSEPRSSSSMETVREEGNRAGKAKPSNSPESILLRGTRSKTKPPSSNYSGSMHRRYSTFINSSNLLYQEYSDVALNQEIQRQKPGDSPAEDNSQPSSPRVRRRLLSSQDSYLQRLSISSADSLWQDIPKIRDSVTFLSMTREEQKLQEAKFELIMSEALYLRSLNIAVDHFQRSTELQELLSAQDRQWLFSRLSEVRDASADFLFDLEEEFESNMYNFQVCDMVISHEPTFRRVYLPYVTNQSYQDRTFQRLMTDTPRFQQVLAKLESDPVCQRLSLKSFLILPFQRITRMRLLLQNILKRSAPGSTEELQATGAHNALEKLIRDCNGSVQRMKDTEELILLNQKIQFECKIFPLISQSRRLVKHGEVTSLEYNSMSFKWKVTTRPVHLHLFNDCLLLSRVREGGRFVVFDHASEFRVERCEIKLHTNQKNIFRVFLKDAAAIGRESSHDVKETEYMFRTETQSQKLRWICALSPPKEEIDFWRNHGLSQMQCLKSYKARENDELSLEKADVLMITQNSDDGWLHGIRLSDQQSGWFLQSNVQPISRNACIRNLEEEQRLQTARAKLQPPGSKRL